MSILLGIDPGLSGAIACLYTDSHHGKPGVWDVPVLTTGRRTARTKVKLKREYDIAGMAKLLRDLVSVEAEHSCYAAIEHVGSRPGQGVVSMFTFGFGAGLWEGLLTGHGIPIVRVGPQKWKHAMLDGAGVGTEKSASILRAKQIFPRVDLVGTGKKPKDGRAEALLLAEYLRCQRVKGAL